MPEAGAGDDVNHVSIALHVVYTPTYPEAPPNIEVRAVKMGGLTDQQVDECAELLREAAASDECLGTAMVYALVEKATEWLVEHNSPEIDMHTEMMNRLAAERGEDEGDDGEGEDDEPTRRGRGGRHGQLRAPSSCSRCAARGGGKRTGLPSSPTASW